MKYIRRYTDGKLIYLAFSNKIFIAEIHENNTSPFGYSVLKSGSIDSTHFSHIESAFNFIENISALRATK